MHVRWHLLWMISQIQLMHYSSIWMIDPILTSMYRCKFFNLQLSQQAWWTYRNVHISIQSRHYSGIWWIDPIVTSIFQCKFSIYLQQSQKYYSNVGPWSGGYLEWCCWLTWCITAVSEWLIKLQQACTNVNFQPIWLMSLILLMHFKHDSHWVITDVSSDEFENQHTLPLKLEMVLELTSWIVVLYATIIIMGLWLRSLALFSVVFSNVKDIDRNLQVFNSLESIVDP